MKTYKIRKYKINNIEEYLSKIALFVSEQDRM